MKNVIELPWDQIHDQLNTRGHAHVSNLLTPTECNSLIEVYPQENIYRNVISMEQYRFGKGEYKYFHYPLLPLITQIRTDFYGHLSALANRWMKALSLILEYPPDHAAFIKQCHAAKQVRPTPLILKYETGGFNTLHQDLYGDVYFPFQIVLVLTEPDRDHKGGELVFTDQLPRGQSKATVVTPHQGDAVIFTTNYRPVQGIKGYYKARMKHGISEVTAGTRYACGIIFHDAA